MLDGSERLAPARTRKPVLAAMALIGLAAVAAALNWEALRSTADPWIAYATSLLAPPIPPPPPGDPVAVVTATVRRANVPVTLSGIATVRSLNKVEVRSRVAGAIIGIFFQEGQELNAGDPVALVDPRPLRAEMDETQGRLLRDGAKLSADLRDQERYDRLVASGFVSRQQAERQRAIVDQDRAQIEVDRAQLEYATTRLGYATIRSPISGLAGLRRIDLGNYVTGGGEQTIVTVTQIKPISIVISLPAPAVARAQLAPGRTALPVVATLPGEAIELGRGTVDMVDNEVDQATGTIKLRASFPNTTGRLWAGDIVDAHIELSVLRDVPVVPAAALQHGPRGDLVWVVLPGNHAESRRVVAGPPAGDGVAITQGLRAGEVVAVQGQFQLQNGIAVRPAGRDGQSRVPPANGQAG